MCGIIACRSTVPAGEHLVPALRRLEYRGYDSAGIAVLTTDGGTVRLRAVGRIDELEKLVSNWSGPTLDGVGIGHTRWATHGAVTEGNAHPHTDCTGRISLVHNGIVENADELRVELVALGHTITSDVDSEVLVHLVEDRLAALGDLHDAVRAALRTVRGSWALAVLDGRTGRLVVAAHRSPLVVARSPRGDFAASDATAIAEWVDELHVLDDGDVVELAAQHRWSGPDGPRRAPDAVPCPWRPESVKLGHHQDFMAKEIDEQPEVADRVLTELAPGVATGELWAGFGLAAPARVHVLACGTSLHAGQVLGTLLRRVGRLPVTVSVASEVDDVVHEPDTLTVAISQSGETADVLRALERTGSHGVGLLALTNNPHSTLARDADAVVSCHAGPEIGVAATKTFVSQVLTATCVGLSALVAAGRLSPTDARAHLRRLHRLPLALAAAAAAAEHAVPALVDELLDAPGFLFLGRGTGVPYAAEGALKLEELTYRWAQAHPAGELKHGPLALVEPGTPVVVLDDGDPRLRQNTAEVRARGARVVSIGGPGTTVAVREADGEPAPPWGPLEAVVPLQVLARRLALALGRDVDKPRNLAKSVTVE